MFAKVSIPLNKSRAPPSKASGNMRARSCSLCSWTGGTGTLTGTGGGASAATSGWNCSIGGAAMTGAKTASDVADAEVAVADGEGNLETGPKTGIGVTEGGCRGTGDGSSSSPVSAFISVSHMARFCLSDVWWA